MKKKGKMEMSQLTVEQKEQLVELFYNVPTKQQTLEMCEVAIKADWEALQHIENQTVEMCMLALEQNPNAEKYFKI